MALIAALEFGDNNIGRYSKSYLVSDCRFVFDRPYNSYRPEGMARCERLELEVIAPGKNDLNLFDWYDKQGVQSGRIVISLAAEAKLTEQDAQIIYFEDAKCFSLSENYDINTSRRRTLKLAIEGCSIPAYIIIKVMATLSNELKAVLFRENFLDNPKNVLKENCLVIQNFSYECERMRNNSSDVYGASKPVILKFSIRVNSPSHAREIYQRLALNGHFDYSILFNVTYDANLRLKDYDDGMVVNGYVVSVEEQYSSLQDDKGVDKQMLLEVKLLVRSTLYMGREEQNNLLSVFIH